MDTITNRTFSLYQSVTRSNPFLGLTSSSMQDVEWRFTQAFGDDNSSEDDRITAVEFDPTGNYVSVGDKAGRLCLFEAVSGDQTHRSCVSDYLNHRDKTTYADPRILYPRQTKTVRPISELDVDDPDYIDQYQTDIHQEYEPPGWDEIDIDPDTLSTYAHYIRNRTTRGLMTKTIGHNPIGAVPDGSYVQNGSTLPKGLSYRFFTEFQSHDAEFDSLKSCEIPPSITCTKWVDASPTSQMMLAANDKTIKLWGLGDKTIYSAETAHPAITTLNAPGTFILPQRVPVQTVTLALRRGLYGHAHTYHINSLSPSSDGAHFVSSDDVRILLWDYEHPMQPFNVVDVRPQQLDEITDVITSTTMHPYQSDLLCYSTSRGSIKLCDLRNNALCDQNVTVKSFDTEEDVASKSFFSEIVTSVTDVKFTRSGQYIISRDFLNVYLWDIRNESRPLAVYHVHDHLQGHLSELYELDSLFDSFKLDASPDGLQIITGSYHNNFSIHNWQSGQTLGFESGGKIPRRRNKPKPRTPPNPTPPPNRDELDDMMDIPPQPSQPPQPQLLQQSSIPSLGSTMSSNSLPPLNQQSSIGSNGAIGAIGSIASNGSSTSNQTNTPANGSNGTTYLAVNFAGSPPARVEYRRSSPHLKHARKMDRKNRRYAKHLSIVEGDDVDEDDDVFYTSSEDEDDDEQEFPAGHGLLAPPGFIPNNLGGSNSTTIGLKNTPNRTERTDNVNLSLINFGRKTIHTAWHPSLDCVAVAGVNKLYIYQAFTLQQDDLL
jgi:serine/threonine-protein phosphatase 2A regulatory subunit B